SFRTGVPMAEEQADTASEPTRVAMPATYLLFQEPDPTRVVRRPAKKQEDRDSRRDDDRRDDDRRDDDRRNDDRREDDDERKPRRRGSRGRGKSADQADQPDESAKTEQDGDEDETPTRTRARSRQSQPRQAERSGDD